MVLSASSLEIEEILTAIAATNVDADNSFDVSVR
jgi:hypothetical protein